MKLAEILGQERAVSILRESIERGRLHHALLFSGPEGIGKRTTAFALAARLLCESRADDSCGACPACVQVRGLETDSGTRHPDLYFETLETNERGKPRKNVSIDQVRELQVALGRSALGGGKKIAIIDEAQA
ncbi:MAG: DNA polymerase III subunit delta', partial [Candidatus Binatia bacterium]